MHDDNKRAPALKSQVWVDVVISDFRDDYSVLITVYGVWPKYRTTKTAISQKWLNILLRNFLRLFLRVVYFNNANFTKFC